MDGTRWIVWQAERRARRERKLSEDANLRRLVRSTVGMALAEFGFYPSSGIVTARYCFRKDQPSVELEAGRDHDDMLSFAQPAVLLFRVKDNDAPEEMEDAVIASFFPHAYDDMSRFDIGSDFWICFQFSSVREFLASVATTEAQVSKQRKRS